MFLLPCPITTPIVHPFRTLKPRRQPPAKPQNVPLLTPSHLSQPGSLPASPLSSSSDANLKPQTAGLQQHQVWTWVSGSAETRAQQSFLLQEPGCLCPVPLALTLIECKDDNHLLQSLHFMPPIALQLTRYLTDPRDKDSPAECHTQPLFTETYGATVLLSGKARLNSKPGQCTHQALALKSYWLQ